MKISFLEWDSHFFNKNVGVIKISEPVVIETIDSDFEVIYVEMIEKFDINIRGYEKTFEETKLIFHKNNLKTNAVINNHIFSVHDLDVEKSKIYDLAYLSGNYSRFRLDKKFTQQEFYSLYKFNLQKTHS